MYCVSKETGLSNTAFDADFKDIEHLVERKKMVVWADQTTEHSNQNDLPGISLLMTFPQLAQIQSIPCCKYNFLFYSVSGSIISKEIVYISVYRTVDFFSIDLVIWMIANEEASFQGILVNKNLPGPASVCLLMFWVTSSIIYFSFLFKF